MKHQDQNERGPDAAASGAPTEVTLDIHEVAYPGKGVGRLPEGIVVFVPGALTGETIRARITRRQKNFAEGRLIEVLKSSPHRIEPACPLALAAEASGGPQPHCPGCCYQHVAYEEELQIKQAQFMSLLRRMGGLEAPPCLPPTPSASVLGYRNKITLHVGPAPSRALGYFAEDNTTVLDVPACPLAHQAINYQLARLRADHEFRGSLNETMTLTLRHTSTDGVRHWTAIDGKELRRSGADDTNWLTEHTDFGALQVPYDSFYQVNPGVSGLVLQHVIDTVKATGVDTAFDLYCGVGVFALGLAKAGLSRVIGVDYDGPAIFAARRNAKHMRLKNTEFVSGLAGHLVRDVFYKLVPEKTALIVDPPRRGLDTEVIDAIMAVKPAHVIYVACAPDKLARDIKVLGKFGYRVLETRLFDMFPRTPYFESVTHLGLQT